MYQTNLWYSGVTEKTTEFCRLAEKGHVSNIPFKYSQTCWNNHLYKTTTRLRWPMLSQSTIATISFVNPVLSDQIHFKDTALAQRVSVLSVSIYWFSVCIKRNVAGSNNKSYPNVFFFPYQSVTMKASYRETCILVQCLILISAVYFAALSDNFFKFQTKKSHPFPCIPIFNNF